MIFDRIQAGDLHHEKVLVAKAKLLPNSQHFLCGQVRCVLDNSIVDDVDLIAWKSLDVNRACLTEPPTAMRRSFRRVIERLNQRRLLLATSGKKRPCSVNTRRGRRPNRRVAAA